MMKQSYNYIEPEAVLVANQQIKVLIPTGIKPGDTFIHTLDDGRVINVMVPDDSYYRPGQFIEIIIPDEIPVSSTKTTGIDRRNRNNNNDNNTSNDESDNNFLVIPKATAGAALLGGVVGAVMLGPIGAVLLAGGAAYCTTRKDGKIGSTARYIGNETYTKAVIAKDWAKKEIEVLSKKTNSDTTSRINTHR